MSRNLPKAWKKHRPNGKVEWYVTVTENGRQKQKYLADYGVSEEELNKRLLLTLAEYFIAKPGVEVGFLAVMNQYLDHVETNQSNHTYRIRSQTLLSFREYLASAGLETRTCKGLLPFHVTQWLANCKTWGQNMRRMAIISLKTCLNWAYNQGILKERILDRLKPPQEICRGQEVILTVEQRQLLIDNCYHDCQKDVLVALYSSGCRPGEICSLRSEDLRLDSKPPVWVVRGKPTKHMPDGVRLVALSPTLVELSRRLLLKHPTGLLFRTIKGAAWYPSLIDGFVRYLRKRLVKRGHKLPAKVIPYGLRHCFATDLLEGGAHDYDVAKLMGHSGTKMIHQVYAKHSVATASRALEHLREANVDSTGSE
jgi:integrase